MGFPSQGTVLEVSGASIPTSYTGAGLGALFQYGMATRARYVATLTGHSATSMTTYTVKLQGTDSATGALCDFFSTRDDSGTAELEHAFTVTAGSTVAFSFHADPSGFHDIRVVGKATGASHTGDDVTITCAAF